jgi:hypothetical protein
MFLSRPSSDQFLAILKEYGNPELTKRDKGFIARKAYDYICGHYDQRFQELQSTFVPVEILKQIVVELVNIQSAIEKLVKKPW